MSFVTRVTHYTKSGDKAKLRLKRGVFTITLRRVATESLRVKIGGIVETTALRAKAAAAKDRHKTFIETGTVRVKTTTGKTYVLTFKLKF